jgi:hypothetical protein
VTSGVYVLTASVAAWVVTGEGRRVYVTAAIRHERNERNDGDEVAFLFSLHFLWLSPGQ